MKRVMTLCVLVLTLTMALCPAALAADLGSAATAAQVCYPTSISRSEDGTELKKIYDLGPEDDPAGIPRSDFEQDGFHYTLTDLLKQELPENESRQHTETVSLPSKNKDMESVLALLPAEKEFVTDDGLTGILSLDLSTVRVEVAGYGSSTKEVSATRSYPNLAGQDMLWLWELRDIGIIGVGFLLSVLALSQGAGMIPLVITVLFSFLTIRVDGSSILDFLRRAACFLILQQQYYEWRLDP